MIMGLIGVIGVIGAIGVIGIIGTSPLSYGLFVKLQWLRSGGGVDYLYFFL